jgi:hypothetical protein
VAGKEVLGQRPVVMEVVTSGVSAGRESEVAMRGTLLADLGVTGSAERRRDRHPHGARVLGHVLAVTGHAALSVELVEECRTPRIVELAGGVAVLGALELGPMTPQAGGLLHPAEGRVAGFALAGDLRVTRRGRTWEEQLSPRAAHDGNDENRNDPRGGREQPERPSPARHGSPRK